MGITSFNAFCADSKTFEPNEKIDGLKNVFFIVIVIVGAIGVGGNILNLFTLRSSLLQTVPFRYIRALALFDLIGLTAILIHCLFKLTGALSLLPIAYYSIYVEDWIINSFLVAGLYCAVLLTFERYLLLRNPHSKRIYINSVSQKICGVLMFSILLHIPLMFQVTAKRQTDGTLAKRDNKQLLCQEPYWTIYSWYGFFRESLRFFCVFILVFFNIFIAKKLQIAKRNRRLLKKHSSVLDNPDLIGTKTEKNLMKSFTEKRLTALMIAICFIYMIGNVPQTIVMIFQNESTETKFSFQLFRYIANTFETLNHCLNFFIFCLASSEYSRAFLNACPCFRTLFERFPFCSRFLHPRRFTISECQSETRITTTKSMLKKDLIAKKPLENSFRRNTTAVMIGQKSNSSVTFCPSMTVISKNKPDKCFIIQNEIVDGEESKMTSKYDFQNSDVFL